MARVARRMRDTGDIETLLKAMRGELSERDMAMIGFGPETKRLITTLIELSPVLEPAILDLAECAYMDGLDAQ